LAVRIALDSNRYADFCRGDARAVETLRTADEIWLPLIVLGELRAGFAHGSRRSDNEKILARFLNVSRVRVVIPDEQTTHFYADLYAALRKAGRPIPTNDLWIAALALQHDLVLFARDSHFDHVPRLVRL
jgi:predicted nucleic acid-binding protein